MSKPKLISKERVNAAAAQIEDSNRIELVKTSPALRLNTTEGPENYTEFRESESSPILNLGRKKTLRDVVSVANDKTFDGHDASKAKLEYQKFQIADISFVINNIVTIAITIMSYDIEFTQQDSDLLNQILSISFATTVISIIIGTLRAMQKIQYLKTTNALSQNENLFTSSYKWEYLLELIIQLIQPYPWTAHIFIKSDDEDIESGFYYSVNDILCVFTMFRIFFVVRMILNLTPYMSPRVVRLSSFYGSENGYLYACKCLMQDYPFTTVMFSLVSSIFVFGYMIRICERPLSRTSDNSMLMSDYWNSMWCVLATMTTVGYGDFYAKTNFGRAISFFCCTWGAFVVSLMVVALNNVLEMNVAEEKTLLLLRRLRLKRNLKSQAAKTITSMAKLFLSNFRNRNSSKKERQTESQRLLEKMKDNINSFRQASKEIKGLEAGDNIQEEMSRQFELMKHEMKDMKQAIGQIYQLLQAKQKEENIQKEKEKTILSLPNLKP